MSWTARAAVLDMSYSSSSWVTRHDSPWEDLVSLMLGCFTEEDLEVAMAEDLLPARLAAGVQQRRLCAQSTDDALSNILRDERQRISSNALAGYQGGASVRRRVWLAW